MTAMTVHSKPTEHPVDTLQNEHHVIKSVLQAMTHEANRVRAGEPLRAQFWLDVVDFLENFADRCHHAKEEDLLFPSLVERGFCEESGPIAVMKEEHVQGRQIKEQLRAATKASDTAGVVSAAGAFVILLHEHIEKEDNILFQLARRLLDKKQTESLRTEFDRVESDLMGEDAKRRYVELAKKLCDQAGVVRDDTP
jgi:hemerythrin-like domain-containing protein